MTPAQRTAIDELMGGIHRAAIKIAKIPGERERALALEAARGLAIESAAEQGVTDPELIAIFSKGFEIVARQI